MIISILAFFVVLSVLVLVHELGHFLLAKKAGVKVEEFGFGLPPRLAGIKRGETVYSLNWIPFGGFVKLYGEDLEDYGKNGQNQGRAFWAKPISARAGIVVAGVVFNFLLALLAFTAVYSYAGIPEETQRLTVLGVLPDSPASESGIQGGDLLLSVDGINLTGMQSGEDVVETFSQAVAGKKGTEISLKVQRDESELTYTVTPRVDYPQDQGPLGVAITNVEMVKYPWWQMPFRAVPQGLKEAFGWTGLIIASLGKMLADLFGQGVVPKDLAGPIGIFQITSQVARTGVVNLIQFMGVLSVNLAIFNILPFPALDGGRIIFLVYELVTRKRPKPELERKVNSVGLAFLIGLIALITVNDLARLLDTAPLFAGLRSLFN